MPPGKPFAKPSAAQRSAWGAEMTKDLIKFFKPVGQGAAQKAVEFMRENPQNIVTQTVVQTERDTGLVTLIGRTVNRYLDEKEATAEAEVAEAARKRAAGEVIDAEFVEEEPPKKTT